MTATSPGTVFVVSHTHWDREWYRTFHEFRVSLIEVVSEVLDRLERDDAFQHFLLDGQAVVLEDYLAIRPEDAERVRALTARGALSVGPWYVLPDEFLVGAEATVRNLMLGHRVAGTVGPVQKVGYLPDSFGHIAQLPQILRLAGIDSFVYTRGDGAEIDELGMEYRWMAPDGSEVLAINQCRGYCAGGELGYHESWHARTDRAVDVSHAVEQVRELFRETAKRSRGEIYLLSNGCDHLPPQRELGRIMAALEDAYPGTRFVHASLADYVEAVAASGVADRSHAGELLGGRLQLLLSGVWSARTYLKQHNERAEQLLAGYVEPLCSYAHFVAGYAYPSGEADYAWRLLLQNHPHDSICGCSVDAVHRDMVTRFEGVVQTGEELLRKRLQRLAPPVAREPSGDDRVVLCVANPLPGPRTEVVERVVVLRGFTGRVDDLQLVDEEGREAPLRVLDTTIVPRIWGFDLGGELFGARQTETLAANLDAAPAAAGSEADCLVRMQFAAERLPPVGHANFFLTERAGRPAPPRLDGAVTVSGDTMENPFVRVRVHPNGTFDLLDKASGTEYTGLNQLEDGADVGDEYDYAPCDESQTLLAGRAAGEVAVVANTDLHAVVEVAFPFELPAAVAPSRTRRAAETVACPTSVRIGLAYHRPVVEIEVSFDNRAKDHRLRALFPTPIRTDTIVSDGHFYVNHRPVEQAAGEGWVQSPPGTYPQQEFSLLQDGRVGLALLNRGLPEIAAVRDDDGTVGMALTLLRAVGWLSRDDVPARGHKPAGPHLATPEAQCLGAHRFCYAVAPFQGDYIGAQIKMVSRQYRLPPAVTQGVADHRVTGGGLLRAEGREICVSAIKKHEVRDTLVLRLYNMTSDSVRHTLHFQRPVSAAWHLDLLEERLAGAEMDSNRLVLAFRPHEIITIEVGISAVGTA